MSLILCALQILVGTAAFYFAGIPVLMGILQSIREGANSEEVKTSLAFLLASLVAPAMLISTGIFEFLQPEVNLMVLAAPWLILMVLTAVMFMFLPASKDQAALA